MSDRDDLVSLRLSKAKEVFRDGEILCASGSWNSAVNRFYYATFHSARALLASRAREAKSHSALIAIFHEEFVKTDVFDRDCARALSRGFERRQKSDYSDLVEASAEHARLARDEAASFVEECERLLGDTSR
jgi:uncharacterized protein (UPF0332 family)